MWRLALKNLKGRKAYSAIIAGAAAAAAAMTLMAFFMSSGMQKELERSRSLLGPDLAVVPPGTKETGHIYLSKGPPQGSLPVEAAAQLQKFTEIEDATIQQRLGSINMDGVPAMLICFDPATDFVIRPWLDAPKTLEAARDKQPAILGAMLHPDKLREGVMELDGKTFYPAGRLRETGSFMDRAIFLPAPAGGQCSGATWILLRLAHGVSLDIMVNKLSMNISGIEVITRPEMLKTINDQLRGLLRGGGFSLAALLAAVGALLITGAVFALMVHERRREFGLLKAMGARNSLVFKLILAEAALLGGTGGLAGTLAALLWLLCGQPGGVPDGLALAALPAAPLLTMLTGALTALGPAWAATRMEPYAAIRGGE
jgi:putative ABC transport system permease protein